MNTLAIWGASSGLGAAMVDFFYEKNLDIIAIARDPGKNSRLAQAGIRTEICDAINAEQVNKTVQTLPANTVVISTMGSFNADMPVDYIGHRHLINALEKAGISRFMLVTSLGCGDSWQYLSERSRKGFGAACREKSLAESWLQSSSLEYTILRPGGLKDGEATNSGKLSQNVEVHGLITRTEVARLAYKLLLDKNSIGQIYQCVDPTITY